MKFESLTMEDEIYCPECSSDNTSSDEDFGDKEFRNCNDCGAKYVINYNRVAFEVYVQY